MLTPERASQIGRLGALTLHARHDMRASLSRARAVFEERFADEVDPQRTLDPVERSRRIVFAKRAYYTRLALRSAEVRSRKGGAQ